MKTNFDFKSLRYLFYTLPYGKEFGETAEVAPPCTLNGFAASTNGEVIPEWMIPYREEISIKEGAELHIVIEGRDTLIAKFDEGRFEKVRHQYVED